MASQSRPQVVTFAGGEVDSYTLARIDLDIHPSTAERMENIYLTTQGAMELAPGTQYIGETPGSGFTVLREWNFSVDLSYALELSGGLIRFIFEDGYEALEGAPATVAAFTDESAAPVGGGDPPTGGGGGGPLAIELIVSNWVADGGGFIAYGAYTVTGGNGEYVSPATINLIDGSYDFGYASGGSVYITDAGTDPVTISVTVQDTAGNSATSNQATIG